jgi:hypothetical protein
MFPLLLALMGPATAQEPPAAPAVAPAADEAPKYATGFRYRRFFLPGFVLDGFYFDEDDEGALPYKRPTVGGFLMGAEFVLQVRPAHFVFYAEYIRIGMDEGYMDDRESPPEHRDGDWVKPQGLGIVAIGANYAHEVALSPQEKKVWVSMMFGGGLGIGFTTGKIQQWKPGPHPEVVDKQCKREDLAPDRLDCEHDEEWRPPPVVPMFDITMTLFRMHIANSGILQLDSGLHEAMPYLGFSAGGEF